MPFHDSPKNQNIPATPARLLRLHACSVIHLMRRLRPSPSQFPMAIVIPCPDRPPQSSLLSFCLVYLLNFVFFKKSLKSWPPKP
ncbi:hypothetical protein L1887_32597 [Cichorium endivia]|nr:hypothetical protein L1887_32597 [Cichorium endivia]